MIDNRHMIRVDIADAQANLSLYLASVEEGETILICRGNMRMAEIRPVAKPSPETRPVGIDRGMTVPSSFFEPLPDDVLDSFEGKQGSR